jgi:hypothetical protein
LGATGTPFTLYVAQHTFNLFSVGKHRESARNYENAPNPEHPQTFAKEVVHAVLIGGGASIVLTVVHKRLHRAVKALNETYGIVRNFSPISVTARGTGFGICVYPPNGSGTQKLAKIINTS